MATNYDLNNTGHEVQARLDQVPATQQDLAAEIQRADLAEQTLDGKIDAETLRAQGAEQTLDGKIDAEGTRAKAAEKQNADDIDAIEEKIPSSASSANKLATEGYVDDKVATDSAIFRGTFNLVSDLGLVPTAKHSQIAYSLGGEISTENNNDYAFVQIPTSVETPTEIAKIERYKFNGVAWAFEYDLNNSGFTAAQWAAINSGITSNDVTKLATLSDAIEAILLLIPSTATALNQLADKAFVNSSIATASATFRGAFNSVSDLHLSTSATHAQIGTVLAASIATADNNDYCFVQIPTSMHRPTEIARTERYKFNGTSWEYEYTLNNSGYTTAQWNSINSGITEELVAKLSALPTNAYLNEALGVLTDGIAAINEKIPSGASSENKFTTQSDVAAVESNLQAQIDTIVSKDATVNLAASPTTIFVGTATDIALTATTDPAATDITIKRGEDTLATGSGKTLSHTDTAVTLDAPGSLAYSADFTIRGLHRSTNKSVTAVYPIFYGAQADFEAASLSQYATPTTAVARAYTVQLDSTRRKFYLRVPKQGVAQVNSVVMGSGSEASPVSGGIVASLSDESYNVWASDDGFTGNGLQVFTVS